MDRRVQKTRQLIMNTFIDLLTEKGFEKITIQDIADRADINRGTVYLHYVDKFDLLDKCVEKYVDLLLHYCEGSTNTNLDAGAFLSVFGYMEKNFTIYKLLLNNEGIGYFRSRLYGIIETMAVEAIGRNPENKAYSNPVTIQFLASGFIGVMEWWINQSMPCSVQEVTERLMFLLEPYTK